MLSIAFVCPRCKGALESGADAFRCLPCSSTYPVVFGIPDFRVEPDPWIGFDEDRDKARRLLEITEGRDLEAGVDAYWAMTPGTSPEYARRFTAYVLGGEQRAAEWLDAIGPAPLPSEAPWLEIGSASGDLIAACAARGIRAVGMDVAMRWLVLARKRASLRGAAYSLVCANGEFLPFPDQSFARVVSVGTLEHCRRAEDVLVESARVLAPGGDAVMRTTNRFSLLPEPHVNLWGVGFLPRAWADGYVRWRGGQGYRHHRVLSARELRRGMVRAGFSASRVAPARLLPSDRVRLGAVGRAVGPVYEWARSAPMLPALMRWIGPLLELRGRRA